MIFLHPEFLYYMLPPMLVLFFLLLTQKESQAHFFSEEVMNRLRVSANTLTLRARNALFLLMGILMVVGLAQPVIEDGKVEIKAKSADIMIALDISDSMLAEDVYPTRLALAKQKILDLLKLAPNERIGVIGFAKNSYLVSPLSFDHGAVSFLLRQLDTSSITEKGTDFISMLEVVKKSVDKDSKKYLLVFSDGGDSKDFSEEIELARDSGIVVYVLGMGTLKGAPIKLSDGNFITHDSKIIVSKLNEDISELATKTGGAYIQNTTSSNDVKAMLHEIESSSEQKELKSQEIQKYIPLFYYPVGLALIILLIATSSLSRRGSKKTASLFVLMALFAAPQESEAKLFDFMELDEAKKAYEAGEYDKSAQIYSEHALSSGNAQSHYNAGNSLYKSGKYEEALEAYEKAEFKDKQRSSELLANIGNAYAKQGTPNSLQKAVESYENSLKLYEDKNTRENLEAVKKALQENKQDSDKNDKSDEESEDKQDENQDSKNEDESKKDKKDSDDKKDSKDKKDESKEKEQESDKNSEEDKKEDSGSENNETKQEKKNRDIQELQKDEDNSTAKAQKPQEAVEMQMSDAEEKKWLDQLKAEQNTYMYMLSDQEYKEEDSNDKPW